MPLFLQSGREDLNLRLLRPERSALAGLSHAPYFFLKVSGRIILERHRIDKEALFAKRLQAFQRASLSWQQKSKFTSQSLFAFSPNLAFMEFNHGFCHRKTQPN